MNVLPAIIAVTFLGSPWLEARNPNQSEKDPIQTAISKFFNARDSKESNEVTVILSSDTEARASGADDDAKPQASPEDSPESAVLITGKPPEGTELIGETEEPAPAPRKGLAVHVEKIQTGTGTIDPSQVKLLAPFPAKPLAQPPVGWHLEASEDAPPFTREVELSPGKRITLTVRPHLLVPDTDGIDAFTIFEPGFEPSLGYNQNATVGAVLSQSIRQLDDDSRQLGTVIDNLQQLLVSLPKPDPAPQPATPTTRTR